MNTSNSRPPALLPVIGPAWYGSVMGTGILSNLLQLHHEHIPFAHFFAVILMFAAWILLIGLSAGFIYRIFTVPHSFAATITQHGSVPAWGMVAMGILATASATAGVLPTIITISHDTLEYLYATMWIIGTTIGLLSTVGFSCLLISKDCDSPVPSWGLAVVPPMVSSTTGGTLVSLIESLPLRFLVDVICAGCFFTSLALGGIIFITAYFHVWRRTPLPLAARPTAWIPLGVVGQSAAAAQSMAMQTKGRFLMPAVHEVAQRTADVYSAVILTIGIPLFLWAMYITYRGFKMNMPYSPAWWAMTFPVGTCCLGTFFLGQNSWGWIMYVSVALTLFLVCTWSIAAFGTINALRHKKISA